MLPWPVSVEGSRKQVWIERISKSYPGRVYYFNTITGVSTWIVPSKHPEKTCMLPQHLSKGSGRGCDGKTIPKRSPKEFSEAEVLLSVDKTGDYGLTSKHLVNGRESASGNLRVQSATAKQSSHNNDLMGDMAGMPSLKLRAVEKSTRGLWKESVRGVGGGLLGQGLHSDATNRTFPISNTDQVFPRITPLTPRSPEGMALMQRLRTPAKGMTPRGRALLARDTKSAESLRGVTGAPRVSAKDRQGWKNYQAERREKVGAVGGGMRRQLPVKQSLVKQFPVGKLEVKKQLLAKELSERKLPAKYSQIVHHRQSLAKQSLVQNLPSKYLSVKYSAGKQVSGKQLPGIKRDDLDNISNNVKRRKKEQAERLLMSFDDTMGRGDKHMQGEKGLTGMPMDCTADTTSRPQPSTSGDISASKKPQVSTCKTRDQFEPSSSKCRTANQTGHSSSKSRKSQSPGSQLPDEYEVSVTVSISDEQKDGEKTSQPMRPESYKRLQLILDTNILLSYLSFVSDLRDQHIEGFGRPTLIIPWIVLQELDSLKDGKMYGLRDIQIRYKGSLASNAKTAVNFINHCLMNKHPRVVGQSIQEYSKAERDLSMTNNDDRILECCLQYKNRGEAENTENVLVTDDMSLRNKAIVSGVHAFPKEGLMKGLADVIKNLAKTIPTHKIRKTSRKSPMNRTPTPKSQQDGTVVMTESTIAALVDDMVCKLKDILREPLSTVLETEMKEAYSDLWLDIILRKPPWTFLDILACIDKHWIAVFSQMCTPSAKAEFEKLKVFYKDENGLGADLKSTDTLLQNAISFLSHLKHHSSYNGALEVPLASIDKMVQQLRAIGRPPTLTSTSHLVNTLPAHTSPEGHSVEGQLPEMSQESMTAEAPSNRTSHELKSADTSVTKTSQELPQSSQCPAAKASPQPISTPHQKTSCAAAKQRAPKGMKSPPKRLVRGPSAKKGALRTLKEVVREASTQAAIALAKTKPVAKTHPQEEPNKSQNYRSLLTLKEVVKDATEQAAVASTDAKPLTRQRSKEQRSGAGPVRTLKEVVREASAQAAVCLAKVKRVARELPPSQEGKLQKEAKKSQLSGTYLNHRTSHLPDGPSTQESLCDDEDVAMDTSSEPEFPREGVSSTQDDNSKTIGHVRGSENALEQKDFHRDTSGKTRVPDNVATRLPSEHSQNKEKGLPILSPVTPAAMWEQLSVTATPMSDLPGCKSSNDIHSTHSSQQGSNSLSMPMTDQQSCPSSPAGNEWVQQVLQRAYQEMMEACTRVEQSIVCHQKGVTSGEHLDLKESCVLVQYLIEYLERSIASMKQVLSVTEINGTTAATGDHIFQGLIDVLDSFFAAMEISSCGSGLAPGMLRGFLNIPENRNSLEVGTSQYQSALQGCRQCYEFMAQAMT